MLKWCATPTQLPVTYGLRFPNVKRLSCKSVVGIETLFARDGAVLY